MQSRHKIRGLFVLIFIVIGTFFLESCTGNIEPEKVQFGYDFFPVREGEFREYEVEEIIYSLVDPKIETLNYELREEIDGYFLNQENDTTYYINRFTKKARDIEWKLDSIWTMRRTLNQAVLTANNAAFVKLTFPVKEKNIWDGNIFNTYDPVMYQALDVDRSFNVRGQDYSKTVTVVQNDENDPIVGTDIRKEVYSRDVGLIYKKIKTLKYCVSPECLGKGEIDTGREYTMSLLTHGKK